VWFILFVRSDLRVVGVRREVVRGMGGGDEDDDDGAEGDGRVRTEGRAGGGLWPRHERLRPPRLKSFRSGSQGPGSCCYSRIYGEIEDAKLARRSHWSTPLLRWLCYEKGRVRFVLRPLLTTWYIQLFHRPSLHSSISLWTSSAFNKLYCLRRHLHLPVIQTSLPHRLRQWSSPAIASSKGSHLTCLKYPLAAASPTDLSITHSPTSR